MVIRLSDTALLSADHLAPIVELAKRSKGRRIILDFEGVAYLSSQALGTLVRLRGRMGFRKLSLRNLHPDLCEVFRVTRLDQLFDLDS